MADSKITALSENTTVAGTDLLEVVDDPGGSPTSQKATVSNVVQAGVTTHQKTRTVNILIGGGSTEIADGVIKGDVMFDFDGTLSAWTLLADQAGAIKIDIWRDTYGNFPPTNDDSICNSHEPEIAATNAAAQDTDLADWADTSIAAGDIWRLNVDSCTTITAVSLCLKVTV